MSASTPITRRKGQNSSGADSGAEVCLAESIFYVISMEKSQSKV
jgi:hypothetical protein